jgi:glycosyltransferase involved in cell wall biosynthesis
VGENLPFRVIGYVSGAFGLGIAATNTVTALIAGGHRVGVVDVDPGGDRFGRDTTYVRLRDTVTDAEAINLFQMNPFETILFSDQWRRNAHLTRSLNAAVPFWELPLLPVEWVEILDAMDVILAPTAFVAEACRAALSRPVVHFPQAVFLPEGITPDRHRFGLPASSTIFLVTLDMGSGFERKNPLAAIEAYSRAFGTSTDTVLLVKTNDWAYDEESRRVLAGIKDSLKDRANVRFMEENLSYRDVLSLYASCDVLVSLHRSEGLGLHLMEAMSLGRPVVATGWSGNMDFMTPDNSRLVPFTLVPVHTSHAAYASEMKRPGQRWAEPDLDSAASLMRELNADRALREAIGEQAARDMDALRRRVLEGAVFTDLQERARGPRDRRTAAARRHLRTLVRRERRRRGIPARAWGKAKHLVVAALLRLGLRPRGDGETAS